MGSSIGQRAVILICTQAAVMVVASFLLFDVSAGGLGMLAGAAVVTALVLSVAAKSWVGAPMDELADQAEKVGRGHMESLAEGDGASGRVAKIINGIQAKQSANLERTRGLTDRIRVLVGEMSKLSAGESASQAKHRSHEISESVAALSAAVHEASDHASQAADAAQAANTEASSGQQVVAGVTSSINSLAGEVERAASAIQKLESDSESIGAILEVIRGIADQTNLLALNAAIEAARAGEQGRGFAVVADEVRTLAQRTQEATEEINDMIARLQDGSSNAVKVMDEGSRQAQLSVDQAKKAGESLQTITAAVSSISAMNSQIASAVQRQSASSSSISESLSFITDLVEQEARHADQRTQLGNELSTAVQDLGRAVEG